MNDRQRSWAFIAAGLMVLGIALFVFWRLFLVPWQDLNSKLTTANKEWDEKEKERDTFNREKRKLDRYRLLGLPTNLQVGEAEYHEYLKKLFKDTGLADESVPGASVTENKVQAKDQGKKPGHTLLTYQIRAHGDWASLVKFLEKFQRAPLLHRIKNFSVDRQGSSSEEDKNPKLNAVLTIEALVVHRGEQRPNNLWGVDNRVLALDMAAALARGPTGWPLVLRGQALLVPELPARDYAELARKNLFVGELPAAAPKVVVVDKKPELPPPDREVLQFVRLMQINAVEQKATLRNLMADTRREMIKLSPRDDTFDIFDDNRRLVVHAEVLRIDQRDVYFQVSGAVYGIHMDQDLADALKKPLSTKEIEKLGLPVATSPDKSGKKGQSQH